MRKVLLLLLGFVIIAMPFDALAGDCGDVNNDGAVDILDIIYLIDYKFKGGPDPDCGETGTVTDIDGNVYQTIKIGEQWWMVENLKVTHYRNGDPITHAPDNGAWGGITVGAFCNYDNNEDHVAAYGRLYNWYAVDDSRNIAPEGWHVPTDEEWKQLEINLGMSLAEAIADGWRGTDEGGKLKEAGTAHWVSPNDGATNESGLTALPGGYRYGSGFFYKLGEEGSFWSSTVYDSYSGWFHSVSYNSPQIFRSIGALENGYSVRCVRD